MLCHAITAWCRLYDMAIVDIFRLQCVVSSSRMVHCRLEYESSLTMRIKPNIVNPVARAMALSRRRSQAVPDKTKYNRKKDKDNANKDNTNEERKD